MEEHFVHTHLLPFHSKFDRMSEIPRDRTEKRKEGENLFRILFSMICSEQWGGGEASPPPPLILGF